jgi:hypothetical protein
VSVSTGPICTAAMPSGDRGEITNAQGGLNPKGLTRIKNAIVAKTYGDVDLLARITEATDDQIRSMSEMGFQVR